MFNLKDYNTSDTIAAIATFPSKSALGVIKISGRNALRIISKIFIPKGKKDIKKVKTYTLHYGWIVDKGTGPKAQGRDNMVDEVLVSVMRAPHTYTREDVVEISSHGGVYVLNKLMEVVLKQEARLALPGEFTYRALIRGRIDLLQAQSISSIVEAQSEEGLKLAALQLRGEVSRKIKVIKDEIKELFIQTEALINFPEDEVEISLSLMKTKIKNIEKRVSRLLEGSREARVLKEGIRGVICGKTNVGKSTLFNCLLREERVIVSELPGTTRDVIEETINIRGVPLRIYDTAGILEPRDLVTKKAIEKSTQIFDEADLVILVLDGSKPLTKDDYFLLEKTKDKNTIFVINKIDLGQRINLKEISRIRDKNKNPGIVAYTVRLSALKNTGLSDLEKAVYKCVYKKGFSRQDIIFLNQYQSQRLKKVSEDIQQAGGFMEKGYTIDFVSASLKSCLDNLGKLSGEVFSEEILEGIFSNFCIGK